MIISEKYQVDIASRSLDAKQRHHGSHFRYGAPNWTYAEGVEPTRLTQSAHCRPCARSCGRAATEFVPLAPGAITCG